jgi:polyisoprenoid-binding protein YceI
MSFSSVWNSRAILTLVFFMAHAQAMAQAVLFDVDSEQTLITLRMSHSVLGRFDTNARSALKGSVTMNQKENFLRAQLLEFKPSQLNSLIGLRDTHLKEDYLEVKTYPSILVQDTEMKIFRKGVSPQEGEPFTATLVVKGKAVKVNGWSQVTYEEDTLLGSFKIKAKISDFGISNPSYMGVGVRDEFEVLVDFKGRPDLSEVDKNQDPSIDQF